MYGYRLWAAKRYPEAEAQLKKVVATYPEHRRASYAQNLIGRAYLDEGKPSLASIAFYDNYKKRPEGERAPDSLYYLAQALVRLKKPADACKVYGELTDVYGTKIDATMKANVAKGRVAAKCQ
jgi:TolA-binding protein